MAKTTHQQLDDANQRARDLSNQIHRLEQPFREEIAALKNERDQAVVRWENLRAQNDAALAAVRALTAFINVCTKP